MISAGVRLGIELDAIASDRGSPADGRVLCIDEHADADACRLQARHYLAHLAGRSRRIPPGLAGDLSGADRYQGELVLVGVGGGPVEITLTVTPR